MVSRRGFLGKAGCVTATLFAGCLSGGDSSIEPGTNTETDWPRPRADSANTAYVPDAKAPRESVSERWSVAEGPASGTPAIVDGRVYLPTEAALLALDAATGNEQWRFVSPETTGLVSPIVYEGQVYVTDSKNLYALDAETGTRQWSHTDDYEYTEFTVISGDGVPDPYLVAGTTSGTVLGLDPQTGDRVWRTDLSGTVSAFGYRAFVLHVGTRDGDVYAFYWKDTDATPREGWHSEGDGAVRTLIPCSDGVAVHTIDGPLRLLHGGPAAGTTHWTIGSEWANSAPVYTNPLFYTTGAEGFKAVRENNQKTEWRIEERYDAVDPVAAGDTLYLSSGDTLHAFAADGGLGIGDIRTDTERWSHPTPSAVGVAVAEGALFVACSTDRTLYCLEPS